MPRRESCAGASAGPFLDEGTEDAGPRRCSRLTPAVWVLLQDEAKEDFDQAIGWCVSLITDYRVRLGTWDSGAPARSDGQQCGAFPEGPRGRRVARSP